MKNKLFVLSLISICILSSCSPRIVRNINKTYQSLESDRPVAVYTLGQTIPIKAEPLGAITIKDSGFSTKCDSATVMSLIKQEARKAGANAVSVTDHERPSFWGSSCHQMTAILLNVIEFPEEITPSYVSEYQYQNPTDNQKLRTLPKMRFAANAGYGWRTAKISNALSSEEKKLVEDLMSGLVYDISGNYYFNDTYGIGIIYTAYSTSTSRGEQKLKDNITFIGPAFLMRFSQNKKWIFDLNLGIGYIGYTSKLTYLQYEVKSTGASLGVLSSLGAEYKFDKNWGIGANISTVSGTLGQMTVNENGKETTIKMDKDQREGLGHIRLSAGIRYYIP